MKVTYTIPLTEAHVEVMFSFPVADSDAPTPEITITPVGAPVPIVVIRRGIASINSQLTYSGRISFASSVPASPLSASMGAQVVVDFGSVTVPTGGKVKSVLVSNKRATTSLSAIIT